MGAALIDAAYLTRMRSMWTMVERRCAITIEVRPGSAIAKFAGWLLPIRNRAGR
jgi:hypothetical protein